MSAGAATPKAGGCGWQAVPELYGPLVSQRGGIVSPQCFAESFFFFFSPVILDFPCLSYPSLGSCRSWCQTPPRWVY